MAPVHPYVQEFDAAWERTERLGLGAAPVRLVVRKDCMDMAPRQCPCYSTISRGMTLPSWSARRPPSILRWCRSWCERRGFPFS
jgi:hypothetical protein